VQNFQKRKDLKLQPIGEWSYNSVVCGIDCERRNKLLYLGSLTKFELEKIAKSIKAYSYIFLHIVLVVLIIDTIRH